MLDVYGISKAFGGIHAVRDLTFQVQEGEILGLLGPNGSGKTTVFNLIAGSLPADKGRILFRGRDITRLPAYRRAVLGLARTFQLVRPFPDLSALDNTAVARAYGRVRPASLRQAKEDALRLLEQLGLGGKAFARASWLTLAERKRLEIARALALEPEVLMLDEPLGGLNPTEVEEGLALFRRLHDRGITLVIVEHNVHAVRALCPRVVVLNAGRKVAEGSPEDALAHPEVVEIYLGGAGRTRRWGAMGW